MRLTNLAYYSLLVFAFFACIPEPLPVGNIPQLNPKIVVSSQIVPDQSVVVILTKSIGALDASNDSDFEELVEQIAINDAIVVIYNETFTDTLTFVENGLYTSVTIPFEPGQYYSLMVESPSMGKVTATARVEPQVSFTSAEVSIHDTGYDTLINLNYTYQDISGPNWYMINVQRLTQEYEADDFLNPAIFTHLEMDLGFQNQIRENEIKVFMNRDFVPGDTLGVFLSNISEDYYEFIQLRLDSRFNLSDFLGEPANYPTNINGGLGFFNLHIPNVRVLVLED